MVRKKVHRRFGNAKQIFHSKKAVVGIETLIIFIAMILVAAVAAGVLVRTSGVLQQKALAVAAESITRVSTGIEVIQITANANTSDGSGSAKEIEILTRLAAGSDPIPLQDMSLSYTSGQTFLGANLAHPDSAYQIVDNIHVLINNTPLTVHNMDLDVDDNDPDTVRLLRNHSEGREFLLFTLTTEGQIYLDLGVDLDTETQVNIRNLPVRQGEYIYGYVTLIGTFDGPIGDTLNNSLSNQNFTMSIHKYPTTCNFNTLRPNVDFCFVTRLGNTNINFEANEILAFHYRLTEEYKLLPDTRVELSLIPSKAIISTTIFFTPQVFSTFKVTLWP